MIQRIQSVWLLLAGLAATIMLKFPLWKGRLANVDDKVMTGSSYLPLFLLIVVTGLVGFGTIFFFKDRKTQKALCLLGMLLSLVILFLEYTRATSLQSSASYEGAWQIPAALPIVIFALFVMARSGVRKDEKILRSLDKLR
jgi:prolipoprotein diacylglyceryltransferase